MILIIIAEFHESWSKLSLAEKNNPSPVGDLIVFVFVFSISFYLSYVSVWISANHKSLPQILPDSHFLDERLFWDVVTYWLECILNHSESVWLDIWSRYDEWSEVK